MDQITSRDCEGPDTGEVTCDLINFTFTASIKLNPVCFLCRNDTRRQNDSDVQFRKNGHDNCQHSYELYASDDMKNPPLERPGPSSPHS